MNEDKIMLRLYVTGRSPNAEKALASIRKLMAEQRPDDYQLEVIDILKQPALAERDRIIATPTLVKRHPPPVRRIIGDLSDREEVLSVLAIEVPMVAR